jgi:hypothetical protein
MRETLESVLTAIGTVFTTLITITISGYTTMLNYLKSVNVSMMIWLLIVFGILLLVLAWRRWRPSPQILRGNKPELLISKGEIMQVESSTIQTLHVKVSNLSDVPVQLLEFAIKTDLMTTPITVEAVEVLGAYEAVELEATMPVNVVGDKGDLKLYAYVTQPHKKIYVVKSEFTFEPWNGRHKVSPLGQTIRPIRRLASSQLERLRKKAWLEQYAPKGRLETPSRSDVPLREPFVRPEITEPKPAPQFRQPEPQQGQKPQQVQRPEQPKKRSNEDLEFPNEF